jgi:hypothetical protein
VLERRDLVSRAAGDQRFPAAEHDREGEDVRRVDEVVGQERMDQSWLQRKSACRAALLSRREV